MISWWLEDWSKEGRLAGWRQDKVISTGQFFFILFFVQTRNTKWFVVPSPPFNCFFFHHSHFDWQFTKGETVSRQDKAIRLFARQDTLEKKDIVGEKWRWNSDVRRKITSLYVAAGCFHTPTARSSRNLSDTNSERLLFILILAHSRTAVCYFDSVEKIQVKKKKTPNTEVLWFHRWLENWNWVFWQSG